MEGSWLFTVGIYVLLIIYPQPRLAYVAWRSCIFKQIENPVRSAHLRMHFLTKIELPTLHGPSIQFGLFIH
jgi:hypothetical protein